MKYINPSNAYKYYPYSAGMKDNCHLVTPTLSRTNALHVYFALILVHLSFCSLSYYFVTLRLLIAINGKQYQNEKRCINLAIQL